MSFPVFDLHCDTLFRLSNMGGDLNKNEGHIDLERAGELPGYAQCFACFTTPKKLHSEDVSPLLSFERQLAIFQREMDRNSGRIAIAYSAADIEENQRLGIMSGVLTIEGPAGFDYDPALLQDLYLAGFRMTTLGWNEQNPLTGSHLTGGGLTDQGITYLEEAQRSGLVVDVSHISDEGFWDIMEYTRAPVVASHSNSRCVCNVSRNLTDDMFRAICQTGGVAGLNMYSEFIGDDGSLDAACDHILHWLELDPDGKHIALGGDLDGCDTLLSDFAGVQDYPALARKLSQRGLDDKLLANLFWNNALEVFRRCCM